MYPGFRGGTAASTAADGRPIVHLKLFMGPGRPGWVIMGGATSSANVEAGTAQTGRSCLKLSSASPIR